MYTGKKEQERKKEKTKKNEKVAYVDTGDFCVDEFGTKHILLEPGCYKVAHYPEE